MRVVTSRILPRLTPENEHYWTSGADGVLRMLRCGDDGHWVHPPQPVCPLCLGRNLAPEALSGRAVVHAWTVNEQPWIPGFDPPYSVAIVELVEQDGLRLTTNIVGCDPYAVTTGMEVQVEFEHHDDVWIPIFRPIGGTDAEVAS